MGHMFELYLIIIEYIFGYRMYLDILAAEVR